MKKSIAAMGAGIMALAMASPVMAGDSRDAQHARFEMRGRQLVKVEPAEERPFALTGKRVSHEGEERSLEVRGRSGYVLR